MVEHYAWENLLSHRPAKQLHVVVPEKVGSVLIFKRNNAQEAWNEKVLALSFEGF